MKFKKNVKCHLKTLIGIGLVTTSLIFGFLVTGARVVVADPYMNVPPKNLIYQADQSVSGSPANLIARIIDLNKNFAVQEQRELFRLLDASSTSDIFKFVYSATEKINPRFWQNWRCSGQSSNLTEIVSKIDHDRFREWVDTPQKVFDHDWKELVHDMYCDNLDAFKTHLVPVSAKAHGGLVEINRKLDQLLRFGVALPDVIADNYQHDSIYDIEYHHKSLLGTTPVRLNDIAALMGKNNFFSCLTAFGYPCTPVTFTCALISGNSELIRNTWDQLDPSDKRNALICGIIAFAERGSLADQNQARIVRWLLNLCGPVTEGTHNPDAEARKLKAILAHTFLARSFEYHRADSVRLVTEANKTPAQIRALLSEETTASVAAELLKSLLDLESDQPVETALACLVRRNDRTSLQWLLTTLREKFPRSISGEIIKRMVVAHDDGNDNVLFSSLPTMELSSNNAIGLIFGLPGISDIIDDHRGGRNTFADICAFRVRVSSGLSKSICKNLIIESLKSGADFREISINDIHSHHVDVAKLILDQVPDKEGVIQYFCEQLARFDYTSPKLLELIADHYGIAKIHQPQRFYLLLHYFVAHRELDNVRNILINLSHDPEMMRNCLYCRDLDDKTPLDLAHEQVTNGNDLRAVAMVKLLEQYYC